MGETQTSDFRRPPSHASRQTAQRAKEPQWQPFQRSTRVIHVFWKLWKSCSKSMNLKQIDSLT